MTSLFRMILFIWDFRGFIMQCLAKAYSVISAQCLNQIDYLSKINTSVSFEMNTFANLSIIKKTERWF